jgi:hypothetical protein
MPPITDWRPIHPSRVRYVKLGEAGKWEKECLANGIVRFGIGDNRPDKFRLSLAGQWQALAKSFLDEGRTKGTATRFTNETRIFFEDAGSTLWITFVGERLYWGMLTNSPPRVHTDGQGVSRAVAHGWRSTDAYGEHLTKDRLSGALTKLAAYRGTSCDVDVAAYVIRRINGEKTAEVERALVALAAMRRSAVELVKLLEPRDFEILVDLIFTTSGWRRLGTVGKTQKTFDLDLLLPSTGEKAFVQVKSKSTVAELARYVARLDELAEYDWMFYAFHTGAIKTDDDRVILLGPEKLAEQVVEAGLINWLIRKVA